MSEIRVRFTDDANETLWIADELGNRLPQLKNNRLYDFSIPIYLSDAAYRFFVAEPPETQSLDDATAFGLVAIYQAPMMERTVLAVEALWFADDGLDVQLPVWLTIASFAKEMGFHGICVRPRSVNTPNSLFELTARGDLDGSPIAQGMIVLQANAAGAYSSFSEGPLGTAAFFAPCIRIFTLRLPIDTSGVACADDLQFYRGEGRLENPPHWRCRDLNDLSAWFQMHGFSTRRTGAFTGSLQEQILQQGYVNQATVSLSKSFEVAAYYATNGKTRDQAVVFEIDGRRLRRHGEIYDSFATMVNHCRWLSPQELQTLRPIVTSLGVLKAGRFLNDCYEQTRRWVESYGYLPEELAPKLDWTSILGKDDLDQLARNGITGKTFDSLRFTFQAFWMFALGMIGSVDTITIGKDKDKESVQTSPVGPFSYYAGFQQVENRLKEALKGQTADHRQPGWDLTAFGYIAKTCRDEEFFSTGPVPGDCIVKATIVGA